MRLEPCEKPKCRNSKSMAKDIVSEFIELNAESCRVVDHGYANATGACTAIKRYCQHHGIHIVDACRYGDEVFVVRTGR